MGEVEGKRGVNAKERPVRASIVPPHEQRDHAGTRELELNALQEKIVLGESGKGIGGEAEQGMRAKDAILRSALLNGAGKLTLFFLQEGERPPADGPPGVGVESAGVGPSLIGRPVLEMHGVDVGMGGEFYGGASRLIHPPQAFQE